jgi:predicted secreted protein
MKVQRFFRLGIVLLWVLLSASQGGANEPPTANAGPDQLVGVGDIVLLTGSASDPDGDTLTYKWTQKSGPVTLEILNSNSPNASFEAPAGGSGFAVYAIELRVTDAHGAFGLDGLQVSVESDNQPPYANAGPDQSATPGQLVQLKGTGYDPDGDPVTFLWSQKSGPVALSIQNADSPDASFTAPDVGDNAAVFGIEFRVTDVNGAVSVDGLQVSVEPVNQPPYANAGQDLVTRPGKTVQLIGEGYDPDGDAVTFQWTQKSGPTTLALNNADASHAFFLAPEVGQEGAVYTFEFKVTDVHGVFSTDGMQVSVQFVNTGPIADAGSDRTVSEGDVVVLDGGGFDSDGDQLTYKWGVVSGPTTINFEDDTDPKTSFIAPEIGDDEAVFTLRLTVTDQNAASATDLMTLTVLPSNSPPLVDLGPNRMGVSGETVFLSAEVSDPDGDALFYDWSQIQGPVSVDIQDDDSPDASFEAPEITEEGALFVFRLTVTDEFGLSTVKEVEVRLFSDGVIFDGIWKKEDLSMNFFIQTYVDGSALIVATPDLIEFFVFIDDNYQDGFEADEYSGIGYRIELTFESEESGTLVFTRSGSVETYPISRTAAVAATPENHGLWKSPNCTEVDVNFYLQTYLSGSAIVVATSDLVEYFVFLDPNVNNGIDVDELSGKPYHLRIDFSGEGTGEAIERCVEAPYTGSDQKGATAVEFEHF